MPGLLKVDIWEEHNGSTVIVLPRQSLEVGRYVTVRTDQLKKPETLPTGRPMILSNVEIRKGVRRQEAVHHTGAVATSTHRGEAVSVRYALRKPGTFGSEIVIPEEGTYAFDLTQNRTRSFQQQKLRAHHRPPSVWIHPEPTAIHPREHEQENPSAHYRWPAHLPCGSHRRQEQSCSLRNCGASAGRQLHPRLRGDADSGNH